MTKKTDTNGFAKGVVLLQQRQAMQRLCCKQALPHAFVFATLLNGTSDGASKLMAQPLLEITDLQASVEGHVVLRDLNLTINAGEVHAIMGPNGSGKSTLAGVLAGNDAYEVKAGKVTYHSAGKALDLLALDVDARARAGLFLAFQYPSEIAGLSNAVFLRSAYNAVCAEQGRESLDALDFDDLLQEKARLLQMDKAYIYRPLNAGFSGGEKKRNEILQMAVLAPQLAILDEVDSGLDIDALQVVAQAIRSLHNEHNAVVLITHYHRILNFITPQHVHILQQGRIVASGGSDLAQRIEQGGYEQHLNQSH